MNQTQSDGQHLVVALKYRPQSFESLVGQNHIATALGNAIRQNRVGHAYLFTGARGVGKTSSARIFAKCLNCNQGPSAKPCENCDACEAISIGEDVDVIEIDGASNRGIDEIRQLRANASIRPSRSPFKIYIIDEVHMLTKEAFNALLKTLEEPPPHVKFIFCTTDPEKIPITVLSRCQRYDFSPVQTTEIAGRLQMIANNEGVEIDDAAIQLLARRANGSMRDSQSLLEQMLSFSDSQISVDDVHQLLGTADISRIAELAETMARHDAANALNQVHQGISEGVDAGQLMGQLLGYYRDMMAVRVQCSEETLLNCSGDDVLKLKELAEQYGLETILSIVQILDATLVRMHSSLHSRTLLEVAVVRICNLEHLDSMADLVASLSAGGSSPKPARQVKPSGRPKVPMKQVGVEKSASKKNEIVNPQPEPSTPVVDDPVKASPPTVGSESVNESVQETAEAPSTSPLPASDPRREPAPSQSNGSSPFATRNVEDVWKDVLARIGDMTADMASEYEKIDVEGDSRVVVTLMDKVNREFCSKPERKEQFEQYLQELTGKKIRVDFLVSERVIENHQLKPTLTRVQQIRKLEENQFVATALKIFEAEVADFKEIKRSPR
ncbi:MAG: DNA polymerase III subunit gamma/tau [Planctomycetota bacterium]